MDLMEQYILKMSDKMAQEIDDYACKVWNVPEWLRNPRWKWIFKIWAKLKRFEIIYYQGYHRDFLQFKIRKKIVGELTLLK